jgi:hypothetical protein
VRRSDEVEPARSHGRWSLIASFAAGAAATALIHSWLWPPRLISPVHFETKGKDRAFVIPPRAEAVRRSDQGPPIGFYEMKVPWNPAPHATKWRPRTGEATTSKVAPSPPVRASVSTVPDAAIQRASGDHPLATQSVIASAAEPPTPGANPPALNLAQDHPIAGILDPPDRGPNLQPRSSGAKSESTTQTYEGTILDAACVAPATGGSEPCGISASTTRFALRLKEGQILPLDSVGNLRAQTAKKKSRWVSKTLAGKQIRAKVSGMIVGNELIAVSID